MLSRGWLLLPALLLVAGCATAPEQPEMPDMDREAIRKVIRENLPPIQHCYEKELLKKPNIKGTLKLEWDLDAVGRVTKTRVLQTVDPYVDECVANVIKGLRFPAPPKGATGQVVYPFVFNTVFE